jgi:endonuclease YncB( thermonuclease family)
MISNDRSRIFAVVAILVALPFAAGIASAEGSFFKDRRDAMATQTKPAPAPTPPPIPAPVSTDPPTANELAQAGGEGNSDLLHNVQTRRNEMQQESRPSPPPPPQSGGSVAGSAEVSGQVSQVLTTDTLVVAGRQVKLAGVRGVAERSRDLQAYIASSGNSLTCQPVGSRYRCMTSRGRDIAQVVLQNGAGTADVDASADYRAAEQAARSRRLGIWAQR